MATPSCIVIDDLPNAFSYSLAQERGLSDRRLRGLVADGVLARLGHGLYRNDDAPPADLDRIEIALRAPEATLCLTSALSLHDLTDAILSEIDVALPRSRRPPRVSTPVRWHRFHEDTFLPRRLMTPCAPTPRASTRWRDFADLFVLAPGDLLETEVIEALRVVASHRGSSLRPLGGVLAGMPKEAQTRWATRRERQGAQERVPEDLAAVLDALDERTRAWIREAAKAGGPA